MKKNKIFVLSSALLACTFLAGCGGDGAGGGGSTDKESGIDISLNKEKLYFGDVLNKNDFSVNLKYSSGRIVPLPIDSVTITKPVSLWSWEKVNFPYTLSYDETSSMHQTFKFSYKNDSIAKTFNFDVAKKYYFSIGDGANNIINYAQLGDPVANDLYFYNSLMDGTRPEIPNVKYKSSNEDVIKVNNEDSGEFEILKGVSKGFSKISAYINDVCYDKFVFNHFNSSVKDMEFNSDDDSLQISSSADRSAYDPNEDGYLFFPTYIGINGKQRPDFVSAIGVSDAEAGTKGAFEDCIKIKNVTIPFNIEYIYANAFKGTSLERATFDVTEGWYYSIDDGETFEKAEPSYIGDKEYMASVLKSDTPFILTRVPV